LLQKVIHEPAALPRALVPTTPRALQAICLKALAKRPADRYVSARALAQEVQRFLADEPVAAYPEPWTVKARRWVGRHRTLATATAATVLVAAVSLAGATGLLKAAHDRERQSRAKAEENRAKAVASLKLAREAVDRHFTRVSEDPRLKAHGLENLRKDLLREARGFYEQILRESDADPDVQAELGRAYNLLGQIENELGSRADAFAHYQRAQTIFEQLTRDHPDVADYQDALARVLRDQAVWHVNGIPFGEVGNHFGEGRALYEAALAIFEKLYGAQRDLPDRAYQLASTLSLLGALLFTRPEHLAQSKEVLERAKPLLDGLVHNHPAVADYRNRLAAVLHHLGVVQVRQKQPAQAQSFEAEARSIRESLVRDYPDVPAYRMALADTIMALANVQIMQKQVAQGIQTYQEAVPVYRRLARYHPDVPLYQQRLSQTLFQIGFRQTDSGLLPEARQSFQAAVDAFRELATEHAEVPRYHNELTLARLWLSNVVARLGEYGRATADVDAALAEAVKGVIVDEFRWNLRYNAGCVYSLAAAAVRQDNNLAADEQTRRAEQYSLRAVALLREACAAEQAPVARLISNMMQDQDLEPLRMHKAFKEFLDELKAKVKKEPK
jgi:tetratricopeptide (TPR) repeat protein